MGTREPAAPFEEFKENPIEYILNQETTLFNKYRALYYIRNNPKDHFKFLGDLLLSKQLGALFKHEVITILTRFVLLLDRLVKPPLRCTKHSLK